MSQRLARQTAMDAMNRDGLFFEEAQIRFTIQESEGLEITSKLKIFDLINKEAKLRKGIESKEDEYWDSLEEVFQNGSDELTQKPEVKPEVKHEAKTDAVEQEQSCWHSDKTSRQKGPYQTLVERLSLIDSKKERLDNTIIKLQAEIAVLDGRLLDLETQKEKFEREFVADDLSCSSNQIGEPKTDDENFVPKILKAINQLKELEEQKKEDELFSIDEKRNRSLEELRNYVRENADDSLLFIERSKEALYKEKVCEDFDRKKRELEKLNEYRELIEEALASIPAKKTKEVIDVIESICQLERELADGVEDISLIDSKEDLLEQLDEFVAKKAPDAISYLNGLISNFEKQETLTEDEQEYLTKSKEYCDLIKKAYEKALTRIPTKGRSNPAFPASSHRQFVIHLLREEAERQQAERECQLAEEYEKQKRFLDLMNNKIIETRQKIAETGKNLEICMKSQQELNSERKQIQTEIDVMKIDLSLKDMSDEKYSESTPMRLPREPRQTIESSGMASWKKRFLAAATDFTPDVAGVAEDVGSEPDVDCGPDISNETVTVDDEPAADGGPAETVRKILEAIDSETEEDIEYAKKNAKTAISFVDEFISKMNISKSELEGKDVLNDDENDQLKTIEDQIGKFKKIIADIKERIESIGREEIVQKGLLAARGTSFA